jgi:hypothetical protein
VSVDIDAALQAISAGQWDQHLRELDQAVRERRHTDDYISWWRAHCSHQP